MGERGDSTTAPLSAPKEPGLVGVISDTHGLLRPQVFAAFRGVSHILHAGDVGDPAILEDLSAVAPVTAVWGNMDGRAIRAATEESVRLELAGTPIALIHGHQLPSPARLPELFPGARVIVFGHTHMPSTRQVDGALMLNPGSAGPRRPGKPVTLALLHLGLGDLRARHIHLAP